MGPNRGMRAHDYAARRERMVQQQIVARGIRDERVIEAMRRVPRHLFVPEDRRHLAYEDRPLPIGEGQTISQPYIVAYMTAALQLKGDEKVLEIGTGSGYQTAILSLLARWVYSIERYASLAERARRRLAELGYRNVSIRVGDGSAGWPEEAPFDAILMTAAPPTIPLPLRQQLADGGRLVGPVGNRYDQMLIRLTRKGKQWVQEQLVPVIFVPMVGRHAWAEDQDDEWPGVSSFQE